MNIRSLAGFCLAVLCPISLSLSTPAQTCPAPGCLDTTFGNGGFVVTSVNGGTASGWADAVTVRTDRKIVSAEFGKHRPLSLSAMSRIGEI